MDDCGGEFACLALARARPSRTHSFLPSHDFAYFLRQRVEVNHFAAGVLMPEMVAAPLLDRAKRNRDIGVEDLMSLFPVPYEMSR